MRIRFYYDSKERRNGRVLLTSIFEKYHVKVAVWIDLTRTATDWLVALGDVIMTFLVS
jgi:hypothetical protein